jgi:hypothetical protein
MRESAKRIPGGASEGAAGDTQVAQTRQQAGCGRLGRRPSAPARRESRVGRGG